MIFGVLGSDQFCAGMVQGYADESLSQDVWPRMFIKSLRMYR